MLALTAPHIKAGLKSRHKELGLSESVIAKSNTVIERALRDGESLTREELIAEFKKARIATHENRASHLLSRAELDGILCSGAIRNGKPTYALLDERVPKTKTLTQDEALAKLAQKYFASHCPATLQDFLWWSGLSVSDAKRALEAVKANFVSETIDTRTYWFTDSVSRPKTDGDTAHLLPAFDEFIISYQDRSAALPSKDHLKAVSDNGIFRPMIVVNGQVMGIWKRTLKKDKAILEMDFFARPDKTVKSLVEKASEKFGRFLGMKADIKIKT
jgi:hypothetical protein